MELFCQIWQWFCTLSIFWVSLKSVSKTGSISVITWIWSTDRVQVFLTLQWRNLRRVGRKLTTTHCPKYSHVCCNMPLSEIFRLGSNFVSVHGTRSKLRHLYGTRKQSNQTKLWSRCQNDAHGPLITRWRGNMLYTMFASFPSHYIIHW
jgi:hypothetical protein